MVQFHHGNDMVWESGKIIEKISSVSYIVRMNSDSRYCRYHIDQMQRLAITEKDPEPKLEQVDESIISADVSDTTTVPDDDSTVEIVPVSNTVCVPQYPVRNRRPPERFSV